MLKVLINDVSHVADYDRFSIGYGAGYVPRAPRIEVRGYVMAGYATVNSLFTGPCVLVPLGCAEAPTNTRWLKALAATCTPAEVAKITAAYEALPRENDQ